MNTFLCIFQPNNFSMLAKSELTKFLIIRRKFFYRSLSFPTRKILFILWVDYKTALRPVVSFLKLNRLKIWAGTWKTIVRHEGEKENENRQIIIFAYWSSCYLFNGNKHHIPGDHFHKFPPKEEIGRIWPPWVPLWMQTILITSLPSLTTIHRILTPLATEDQRGL
jgi:hypothetical protein